MTETSVASELALSRLALGVYGYVQADARWGLSNAGLVASEGEALLVDTQYTPQMTRHLLDAIAAELPDVALGRVVTTHANGDHCWGLQLLPDAEVIATAASAAHQCREISPAQMTALQLADADTPLIQYVRHHFAGFDFTEVEVRQPTVTFTGSLELTVGKLAVELIEVGPAHTKGDAVVHVPEAGVVFAGDILFVGAHPMIWDSLTGCIKATDRLLATGAEIFVPGHGPVVGRAAVEEIRDQMIGVAEQAFTHAQLGTPLTAAARQVMQGQQPGWVHPERLYSAVASAYVEAGIEGAPSDALGIASGMAALAG
ncbi:MBL fold metallo-hydrolase [Streptomyces violascens]|uniref:MBL fold metallo-hydrolase n=1 Tax=Streptomyces violascens TaxID=67381 RepID=UPI00365A2876